MPTTQPLNGIAEPSWSQDQMTSSVSPQNKHCLLPHLLLPMQLSSWIGCLVALPCLAVFRQKQVAEVLSGSYKASSCPDLQTTGGDIAPFLIQNLGLRRHDPLDSEECGQML